MSINKFLQPGAGGAAAGALYGAGNGDSIGYGNFADTSIWAQEASGFTDIEKVSADYRVGAILRPSGDVYFTGQGTTTDYNTAIGGVSSTYHYVTGDILDVSAGEAHALLIKNDGTLWAAGEQTSYGNLGVGDNTDRNVFTQEASGFTDWKKCFTGNQFYSAAIRENDDLYFCGQNDYHTYGTGSNTSSNTFVYSTGNVDKVAWSTRTCLILTTDGKIYGASSSQPLGALGVGDGSNHTTWTQEASGFTWLDVACMKRQYGGSTCAIRDDGSVWGWGKGQYSRNGDPTGTDHNTPQEFIPSSSGNFIKLACGDNHGLALTDAGDVWFWGADFSGRDGDGDYTDPEPGYARKIVEGSGVFYVEASEASLILL